MTTTLIAGCGYLGATAGSVLAALGQRVLGLRRDPSRLPPSIEPLTADLSRPGSWDLPPVDNVVFTLSPSERSDEGYRQAYVANLSNLFDALHAEPPGRVLFVSSTAVYGREDGGWVDERTTPEPAGFAGRRLLEAEELLRSRCAALAPQAQAVCLRLGGIYGPGRTRLIESVLNGESDLTDGPPRFTNRIHRDDAALAIVHLLELEDPAPVYCGVDREPADEVAVLTWLADRLDVPRPTRGERRVMGPRGNKRVSSDRLVESGFEFRFPTFREGYDALIESIGESLWHRGEQPR
jgi:nucleoside-diphosphate-sugar epimerase